VPYLIDGNNLLGSWGGPAVAGDGRHEVVRRVADFCRVKGASAIVVFDGAPFRAEIVDQQLGSVTIRFPPAGLDADTLIRQIVDGADRPGDFVVVSSDKPVYSYARTRGARAITAREWNELGRQGSRPPGKSTARPEPRGEKPERESDVEGWLKRFSRE
jgi:predicted RNA-binding protein with PIN domain